MARSLYSTVLHNYSYSELKDLCFAPGSTFGNVFDCDWGVWRDKAITDFSISPQFFDLVTSFASNGIRTLTGPQRYLQMSTYVKLTPLSGVRVYENGKIEGVYEAFAGFNEAARRKDWDMIEWFAERASPENQKSIKQLWPRRRETESTELGSFPDDKEDLFIYLIEATVRGRIDLIDEIIHDLFTLPKNFSIARDVHRYHNYKNVDFWKNESYLLDLPLQELDETIEDFYLRDLLRAALESGDTRIVDFYLSIFRDREKDVNDAADRTLFGRDSLLRHGKPEDAFGTTLRLLKYKRRLDSLPNHIVEVALFLQQMSEKKELQKNFLISHLGDITSLIAVFAICDRKDIEDALQNIDNAEYTKYEKLYPLSVDLLRQQLQIYDVPGK
ncbi:hypothetical protein [Cedratvirus kamchatka]|uniref:Uncharacterized protein n=1 Tax=Cedratvirus kamchatka TaxID=2716914 RepID=A0A6G8MYG4_9VIRU|nr:hypothetical protein [Cedratvirus kamchatka]